MEYFLWHIQIMLPVTGLDILKPKPQADDARTTPIYELEHKKSGVRAEAIEADGEFIVTKGSGALKETNYQSRGREILKQDLIARDILAQKGQNLVFTADHPFKSTSAAAAVILDRNANGRTEWKVKGTTQTYQDWHEAQQKGAE